jgi:thermostable 8-oxoguanine DNA glycosylase
MPQVLYGSGTDGALSLALPDPTSEILPGVVWGRTDVLFTPAYWASQVWLTTEELSPPSSKSAVTLREEVAACLLGGYGMPSEVGQAAFQRLRDRGMLADPAPSVQYLCEALSEPLVIGVRHVNYRFPLQKSRYLSIFLNEHDERQDSNQNSSELRSYLLSFPGIGPKTSSWIVTNWLDSDEVAIIDVHVFRAGVVCGLYSIEDSISRSYYILEEKFLDLARAMGVRASKLDLVIWWQLKKRVSRRHRPRLSSVDSGEQLRLL